MPIELQIIRAQEFVRVGTTGKLDLEDSRRALATLARACHKRGNNRALLDVRSTETDLTPNDLAQLVKAFEEIGFTGGERVAILHVGKPGDCARLFALLGRLRGWKVQAFATFEEALEWLSQDTTDGDDPHSKPGAIEVPVNVKPKSKEWTS